MKDQELLRKNLAAFIEGELSLQMRRDLQKLIEENAACRSLYEKFRAVYEAGKAREEFGPSPDFYARLQARIDQHESEKNSIFGRWSLLPGRIRLAASSFVILAALLGGHLLGRALEADLFLGKDSAESAFVSLYGLDQFQIQPDLLLPEIYEQVTQGDNHE